MYSIILVDLCWQKKPLEFICEWNYTEGVLHHDTGKEKKRKLIKIN